MESVAELLCFDGTAVLLVKPQFEAGRAYISSGGIVKNPKVHRNVIMNVIACAKSFSLGFKDLTYSPIKGGSGNTEYLLYLCKNQNLQDAERSEVERVVELALKELK
jgi:23S rRNA (cytidine1920-2'-O)/16S rRNA (cytidine1409-2'-O)-methyltransferase